MDNHTRKLLGLTDEQLFFDEEWLIEKEYKGVQVQFIKGKLDDATSYYEHYRSVRIIRNGFYTTRTQMLKFKEKLTILELKRSIISYLPTVLCVDEFNSMKSVSGSMSFIYVDGTTNQLFTILEDRRLYKLTQ